MVKLIQYLSPTFDLFSCVAFRLWLFSSCSSSPFPPHLEWSSVNRYFGFRTNIGVKRLRGLALGGYWQRQGDWEGEGGREGRRDRDREGWGEEYCNFSFNQAFITFYKRQTKLTRLRTRNATSASTLTSDYCGGRSIVILDMIHNEEGN